MKITLMTMAALFAGVMSVCAETAAQPTAAADTKTSAMADARGKIDQVIAKPETMKDIMKGLSAAEQKQFLADVNKAICDMPGSSEEKAAKFLNVNSAALRGAAKGNVATLLAEVFATVPPEALTVINERFAVDLVNRAADPNVKYTDEEYTKIALDLMAKVNERCEETDNGSPRAAFAILMLVRASNGTPEDLADKLIETLKHEDARDMAKAEWIPSALGLDGRPQSYESLLASADAGRRPDLAFTLVVAGPQFADALLHDLNGKNTDPKSFIRMSTPMFDAVQTDDDDGFLWSRPRLPRLPDRPRPPEPRPYPYQNM